MTYVPLIVAGALALAFGSFLNRAEPSVVRTAVKAGSVAMLAVWAIMNGAHGLLALALVMSSIGDGFLAQKNSDKWLLPGMAAFFAAHIAYVVLFNRQLENGIEVFAMPQLVLLAIAGLFLGLIFRHLGPMRWPVLAYACVILAMGCAALSLPPQFAVAMYGAAAFILSDALLSLELFVMADDARARKVTSPLLWFLYWGGQAAITYAFVAS